MNEIWFVRAGRESVYADDFVQKQFVALGWPELQKIESTITKPDLLNIYHQTFPDHPEGRAQTGVSQILRFLQEIKIGDMIMTYDRDKQMYYFGTVIADCKWEPQLIADLPLIRKVEWKSQVPRNLLTVDAKNTLGAIQAMFLVKGKVAAELQSKLVPIQNAIVFTDIQSSIAKPDADQFEREREIREELLEKAEQAIEDRIIRLEWEQMQELVAGIIRAMGYRTKVSARGPDRGVDIFASRDGLGLEEPRIFIEVKHRASTAMGSQEIRSFLGGRKAGDKCLYVSTGGFTQDARYEAERSSIAITLLGLVDIRRLLVEYYDLIDEKVRSLIPLRKVFVLAE